MMESVNTGMSGTRRSFTFPALAIPGVERMLIAAMTVPAMETAFIRTSLIVMEIVLSFLE